MKVSSSALAASFCLFSTSSSAGAFFIPSGIQSKSFVFSPTVLRSATEEDAPAAAEKAAGLVTSYPGPNDEPFDMFQDLKAMKSEHIEGGGTVRTFAMPAWADRLQYRIESTGRPLRAMAQIWLGPQRKVHTMEIDNENGEMCPFQTTMKFKKQSPVLKISTSDTHEYPCKVRVSVPTPEWAKELAKNTERIWDTCPPGSKLLVQGGRVGKKGAEGGAWRAWNVPPNVESIQLIGWSKDVSQKSFKLKIELLQGPNCNKQLYNLQCGGGSQPYHAVFQTPGDGWTIRIYNKKFMEDGLTQMCILPLDTIGPAPAELEPFDTWGVGEADGLPAFTQPAMRMGGTSAAKQWWE